MFELRSYQLDCCRRVYKSFEKEGFARALAVLGTGGGKTVIFSRLAKKWIETLDARVLILADRDELISQAVHKLNSAADLRAAIEKAEQRATPGSPLVVSSIQTISRRLEKWQPGSFTHIICDEAHLSISRNWATVLRHLCRYPLEGQLPEAAPIIDGMKAPVRVLGVTATPFRADKKLLCEFYEAVAYERSCFDLIGDGYLVPIKVRSLPIRISLNAVKTKGGDFDEGQLSGTIEPYFAAIADAIKLYAPKRRILAFLPLIATSQKFAAICNERGVAARHIDGGSADRAAVLAAFAREDCPFQVVTNSALLTTGVDIERVDCILNLRPTKSATLFQQIVGRGTRILPGIIDGLEGLTDRRLAIARSAKPDCIAEGSLVLTDHGLVPVEKVQLHMKVWDGVEFVNHCGTVFKGTQAVITYAGLTATPDHLCYTQKGWEPLSECAAQQIPIAVTGNGRSPVREANRCFAGGSTGKGSAEDADVVRLMRSAEVVSQNECSEGSGGMQEVWQPANGSQVAGEKSQCRQRPLRESELHKLRAVWRKRNRVPVPQPEGVRLVGYGKPWRGSKHGNRPDKQQWSLRAREFAIIHAEAKPCAHQKETNLCVATPIQTGTPRGEIRRWNTTQDASFNDLSTDSGTLEQAVRQTQGRVWDILNCGPRNRFTANGLLVHNCLILDCLWQYEKLGIQRPAHLFAATEEEAKEIGRRLDDGGEQDLVGLGIDVAADREEALRKAILAKARRNGKYFDAAAFAAMVGAMEALDYEPIAPWERHSPTTAQKSMLERWGIRGIETRGEANRIIDIKDERKKLSLATPAQVRQLFEMGVNDAQWITEAEAQARITARRQPMNRRLHRAPSCVSRSLPARLKP
jgi:superfamily II DNA or RNA helicase